MTNRLIEITAEIEMLREVLKVEKNTLLGNLESVLYNKIVAPCCANLIRTTIRRGWHGKAEVYFQIGFWNAEENRIDFASDVEFYFGDDYKNLTLNHGTCGYFNINNFYLVKRARMINYVFDHYGEIEDALTDILENKAAKYLEIKEQIDELTYEKECHEKKELLEKKEKVSSDLVVGVKVSYGEDVPLRDRIFVEDRTTASPESRIWSITKVTPKFVTLSNICGTEFKCKKEALVNEIVKDKITVA